MPKKSTLEGVLKQKLRRPNILYLLGAGASMCARLPGIMDLTKLVRSSLTATGRPIVDGICRSLDKGGIESPNIEEILTELYHRLYGARSGTAKSRETQATFAEICTLIWKQLSVGSSTDYHRQFVQRLAHRRRDEPAKKAPPVQIFTTNYDLLIELACEEARIVAINGFEGIFRRRWNPSSFDYDIGKATGHVKTSRFEPSPRHIRLYKLHGSLSWFEHNNEFCEEKPTEPSQRIPLLIYPSRLKYAESLRPPFDWLFRRFGAAIREAELLVSIGYSFQDEHLNDLIFAGLNDGLSLFVLTKKPVDALGRCSTNPRVTMISESTTVIDGKPQEETTELWAFESFAKWLPALKEK